MRRAETLVVLSRRQFCGGVATCLGLTLAGCVDGDIGVVETGPLGEGGGHNNGSGSGSGSGSDSPQPDAGMSMPPPDAGTAAMCPTTGATDVGAPTTFTANKPVYYSAGNFFVVRDGGGLYALTSRCTHEGVTCTVQNSQFYCPRHGAKFDLDGAIVSGPVFTPLAHYAMCRLPNGNVGVITSMKVAKTERLVA